jgi:hypothetical protein
MRKFIGGACSLALALAIAAPAASAQVLDSALARLPCESPGDPPAAPGRRASQAAVQAAAAELTAWIERRNQTVMCYGAAANAMIITEGQLVDEFNRQGAEARAAQQAWVAARAARPAGRTR